MSRALISPQSLQVQVQWSQHSSLLLDGRRSCIKDSFAGHLGLHYSDFLAVNIYYVVAGSQLDIYKSRQRKKLAITLFLQSDPVLSS